VAQSGLIVRGLQFDGNKAIDNETLAAAISTTNSDWFARAPILRNWLGSVRRLSEKDLERDVERLRLLYRIYGFLEVQVDTLIVRREEDVHIKFVITEGEPVRLTKLDILGMDSIARRDRLERDLPLRTGDPFNRYLLQSTGDTLTARLREQGYASARVFLLGRTIDSAAREAQVVLRVQSGRQQVIGRIQVEGAPQKDSAFVVQLMAARSGQQFKTSNLYRSQRNIAATESYRFVSVEIDTSLYRPEGDSVPLIVRLVPGRRYRLGASAGYGTDDCFRGSASMTVRNMFRQGRLLEISGRLTKIGTGAPLDFGLDDTFLCSRLQEDPIGSSKLNYAATISLRQPAFLSPDNVLGLQLFAERRSEFAAYLREEVGGAVSMTRETGNRIPVTVGYRLAWGSTDASDANFCAYFNACNPADIEVAKARQRQGIASVGVSRLRVNNILDPSRGTSVGLQGALSATFTGSEELQRFARVTGDASLYMPLTPKITAAFRLRAGFLTAPEIQSDQGPFTYVTPDQRFYAGGANDVRGYDRNDLGPVVYVVLDPEDVPADSIIDPNVVTVSPIGGNRLGIANAEIRVPFPLIPRWRLVGFLDAGAVWEDVTNRQDPVQVRFTPGVGVRVGTPLGPARLDVAYNGYGYPAGQLYLTDEDGTLVLSNPNYVKPGTRGLTFHLAIGQAF